MKASSKIEILREIQKELEMRKAWKNFYNEDFLTIDYDVQNDYIYANWKGYQTESSIMKGCDKILEAMKHFGSFSILNDNTNVLGIWTPAVSWVAQEWLPRMVETGLKKFAWIYSPAMLSKISTDETLSRTNITKQIKTFNDVPSGVAWLVE